MHLLIIALIEIIFPSFALCSWPFPWPNAFEISSISCLCLLLIMFAFASATAKRLDLFVLTKCLANCAFYAANEASPAFDVK